MRQRWAWTHRYAVPMFVSSLVAVVLSGSGLIAVLVFADGGGGGAETEDCAVGAWRVTNYTEQSELGSAQMIEGEPVLRFDPDGTGVADFGDLTRMEVESFVLTAVGEITGQIGYRYEASGHTLEFVDQESNATMTAEEQYADLIPPGHFTLPEGPLDYTCDGDAMTFTDGEQSFQLQRL